MLIEIGHEAAHGPAVTYARIPDEAYPFDASSSPGAAEIALHLARSSDGVTHLPGLEAFLAVSHPAGVLAAQGIDSPKWVRTSDDDLTELLSAYHGIPGEAPADLEDTHWTRHGSATYPPGAFPPPDAGITALLTNAGRDIWDLNLWSGGAAATAVGQTGTATATTATSLTGGTEAPGGAHATSDAVGQVVVAWSSGAYGLVTASTSGTSPVYTVDRWYVPGTPGGTAAATPSGTTGYSLLPGGPPALFMGLSANATAVSMSDVALPSEIATAGGGLIRKICVMAHTAGANTTTATAVFTANGSDSLPVTVAKLGIGPSIVSTVRNALQTLLSATATLNVIGDQLTITDTITSS